MNIAEVRQLTDQELVERVNADRIALNQMVLNHSVSPVEAPSQIRAKRRTIARLLSELRQRELNKK